MSDKQVLWAVIIFTVLGATVMVYFATRPVRDLAPLAATVPATHAQPKPETPVTKDTAWASSTESATKPHEELPIGELEKKPRLGRTYNQLLYGLTGEFPDFKSRLLGNGETAYQAENDVAVIEFEGDKRDMSSASVMCSASGGSEEQQIKQTKKMMTVIERLAMNAVEPESREPARQWIGDNINRSFDYPESGLKVKYGQIELRLSGNRDLHWITMSVHPIQQE